jgi:hypothetical protein
MAKIYDCFPFFNELDILDIRLHELNDVVDHFVICESAYTFTGAPKPKIFSQNRDRYSKFLDKIIYISVEEFPDGLNQWDRDIFQREKLKEGVAAAQDEDLIIVSDVDEIPRVSAVQKAQMFDGTTQFSMNMYQYFINMLEREDWACSYALQKKYLNDIIMSNAENSLTVFRYDMRRTTTIKNIPLQTLTDAGWHFTHMGSVEKLKDKFAAYAHATDYWPQMMQDSERLQQQIDLGIKIWSAEVLTRYVPVDETYPFFVKNNVETFLDKGYIKDIYQAHASLQKMYVDLKRKFCFSNLMNKLPHRELGNMNALQYLDFAGLEDIDLRYLDLPPPAGVLISENKTATQSSLCSYSVGDTVERDASRALVGSPTGRFSFHTEMEWNPWWMVDLEDYVEVSEIRIFNRVMPFDDDDGHLQRINELQISISNDNIYFELAYFHDSRHLIGGIDGRPLIFHPERPLRARYIKLHLSGHRCFHLDKVFVYKKG